MNVNKEAGVDCGLELSPEEMERINAMSKKKLEPGEVYAFAVRLCDNEIDRDNERFPAATLEELDKLPGVGPVIAQRIIDYREQNNGFYDVQELMDVSGIGEKTFAKLEPYITTE